MKVLTLRSTWAWFVVNGYKDIENRSWRTRLRGRIWIHASSSQVTRPEYEEFLQICREQGIRDFPRREAFKIGGIVGSVEIIDCVRTSPSYWFEGEYGFVLKNARKTRFRAMKGRLGFFEVAAPLKIRSSRQAQATDFVAYHSVELMGHEYQPHNGRLQFFSKKRRAFLEKAIGRKVWVITGTRDAARRMVYRLAAVHTADAILDSDNTRVIEGRTGHVFSPPIELSRLPWFRTLFKEQNQFSYGFNRIRNPSVIRALRLIADSSVKSVQ